MYRIGDKEAEKLIEEKEIREKKVEKHVLLGRSGIFSFEEDNYFYAVMERDDKRYIMHVCKHKGEYKRGITSIESREDKLLLKIGLEPFMRLDIKRFVLENNIKVEKVEQLGYHVNKEGKGLEKVHYGEVLRDKMSRDSEYRENIFNDAKSFLNSEREESNYI